MESGVNHLEKTSEIIERMMNSVCSWLILTMEHEGMFNGVLPTLDLVIWISDTNKELFSFYEKEMVWYVTSKMNTGRTVARRMCCTRTSARHARWT